jgi:hypothetical protein
MRRFGRFITHTRGSGAHAPFHLKGNAMRRTILYTTGLMIAAGASLALAGPASAAPAPSHPNYTNILSPNTNLQYLGQTSVTTQTVLNNIGNTTIGGSNYGGSASAVSYTGQYANQLGGAGLGFF